MATHSSIPAWRIPWTEQSGRLYSSWGCKESDMSERLTLSLFHTGVKKGRKKALSFKYKWKDKGKLRQKINCQSLKLKKISNTKTVFWNIEAKNKIIIVKEVMGSEGEGRRIIDFVFAKVVELFDFIHTYIQSMWSACKLYNVIINLKCLFVIIKKKKLCEFCSQWCFYIYVRIFTVIANNLFSR